MKKVFALFLTVILVLGFSVNTYAEDLVAESGTEVAVPIVVGTPTTIIVHRVSNLCAVYNELNQLMYAFVCSTGKPGHETPLGVYQIYQHSTGSGYHLMVDGTYGRYCMRFKEGGYMIHSVCYAYKGAPEPIAEEVEALGTSVSRGCVRLGILEAELLYSTTPNGCTVIVLDD